MNETTTVRLAGLLLLIWAGFVPASQGFSTEQLRAPFLFHIVNFTTFADEQSQTAPVYFCFMEDNGFGHARVFRNSARQMVKNRRIQLLELTDLEQLQEQYCHLLFVSQEQESDALFLTLAGLNQQTISIGESMNFIEKGGMMAILPLQSKMKIFFNKEVYQSTELKFSSALLKRVNFR
ncbi:YfiR family protein [Bowmanella dokdonensis]|uniref:YfiR family protein n=1 Tax=Bowmanella dokdonensis TaxID=751969 RepID=A0A939DNK5_9ALTE|nr:YfiR family protein [Bowmanella dokdonensis]MBN7826083.1 YfiR family protein [Bowmanella dokdonensis]